MITNPAKTWTKNMNTQVKDKEIHKPKHERILSVFSFAYSDMQF